MRGLVMVLMTIDHASGAFNAGRLMTDSAARFKPGTSIDTAQFFTRWITHLCAPTFVFLAGAALALSVARRQAAGMAPSRIDRDIAIRGVLLVALELVWMSWIWRFGKVAPFHWYLLQVLYAIGGSMLCMIALRRLSTRALLVTAIAILVGFEALARALPGGLGKGLLVWTWSTPRLEISYPLVPWLAIMMLGWAFGRHPPSPRQLALCGLGALALFCIVRGLDGYGNALLYRDDSSLVQWLHVSKYPPSLAYTALELGLMALVLAALMQLDRPGPRWLVVLGQTALFFYVLHVHVLKLAAYALGRLRSEGLAATYLSAALAIVVLLPLCSAYRRYKSAHPETWVRFL